MDETTTLEEPTAQPELLHSTTEEEEPRAARAAAQLEHPAAGLAASAQIMYRPAPVPAGHIAVEVPDAPFWFLVRPDLLCVTCAGVGRLPNKGDGAIGPEDHCSCVLSAVEVCFREVNRDSDQHNAELRVDRADKDLERRVDKALARVNELEQECAAAVGDCEREQRELEERVPGLAAAIEDCERTARLHKQDAQTAGASVIEREREAEKVRNDAIFRAHAAFTDAQRELSRERQEIAAELQSKLDLVGAIKSDSERAKAVAEDRLAYLKAGPEKIRRRFEEKLQGPRATLDRLERQWKR